MSIDDNDGRHVLIPGKLTFAGKRVIDGDGMVGSFLLASVASIHTLGRRDMHL